MDLEGRRAFLKALGVSVPAFAASSALADAGPGKDVVAPARPARWDPRGPIIRADEVFMIYVSEALSRLPSWAARDPASTMRTLIEAQAAGLAAVIMEIERRQ